jgi:hypothetical protein
MQLKTKLLVNNLYKTKVKKKNTFMNKFLKIKDLFSNYKTGAYQN